MEFITDYINVVVMLTCLGVGYIVKHLVPGDKVNRFIPIIVGVLGVALNAWANLSFSPAVICGGLISGLSSTGLYEAFDQFIHRKDGDDHGA